MPELALGRPKVNVSTRVSVCVSICIDPNQVWSCYWTKTNIATINKLSYKQFHLNKMISPQREGYPETCIFSSNVGYVLAQTICFNFCKHEVRSKLFLYLLFLEGACWNPLGSNSKEQTYKEFTPGLMFTKYEADRLNQNITYITTNDTGFRVSVPLTRKSPTFLQSGNLFKR